MARNCTVYSFDPSMSLSSHSRPSGVHFYPYALGTSNAVVGEGAGSWRQNKTAPAKWTQRSLRSLMRQFGHTHISLLSQ